MKELDSKKWRNSVLEWVMYRRGARWFWSLKFLPPWPHLSATAPVTVVSHTASIRFLPLYWEACLNTYILTLSMFIFASTETPAAFSNTQLVHASCMNVNLKGAPFGDMSCVPNSDSSGSPWRVQLSSFVWKFLSLDHVENIPVYIHLYFIECVADKRSSTEWIQET
jgi:hypothetical protein